MVDEQKGPGLKIDQIVLERLVFDHCPDWLARPPGARPDDPDLQLRVSFRFARAEDGTGAAVAVIVQTIDDVPNPQRYKLDVSVVGIVTVEGEQNVAPDQYVLTTGASLLFPFVREAVANVTMRGRFGPIWLKPFNVKVAVETVMGQLKPPRASKTRAAR